LRSSDHPNQRLPQFSSWRMARKEDEEESENFKVFAGCWIVSKSNGDVSRTLSQEGSSNQNTILQFQTLASDKFQLLIELPVDGTSTLRGTLWTRMEIDHR
jgi:hypothetical protein